MKNQPVNCFGYFLLLCSDGFALTTNDPLLKITIQVNIILVLEITSFIFVQNLYFLPSTHLKLLFGQTKQQEEKRDLIKNFCWF